VRFGHPSGTLRVGAEGRQVDGQWTVTKAIMSRSAPHADGRLGAGADIKGNTLLIQILTKSMVMDRKAGRRLVDGCVHDVQRAAEADLRNSPRPSLFGPASN
jgi:hypothetical protein